MSDRARAIDWYQKLLGKPPAFYPNDDEAVWQLAPNRYLFIEVRPENAGHARHLLFVENIDALVAEIAARGLQPVEQETLASGVRKASYRDPDGNRFEFGGTSVER